MPISADLHQLLTPCEMSKADALTIKGGTAGIDLMERAGAHVADHAGRLWLGLESDAEQILSKGADILILCGPGNNGGDGFIAARLLSRRNIPVRVALAGKPSALKGDAAIAYERWSGDLIPFDPVIIDGSAVIIDAIFGAGLSRNVTGIVAEILAAANQSNALRLAVDLPSGVNGNNGQVMGICFEAAETVTFCRAKPGHYLRPGKHKCGHLHVEDIGINLDKLADIQSSIFVCCPQMWDETALPLWQEEAHKYDRGHAVVIGGQKPTLGASRLTAMAALRAGAGLVSLMASSDTYAVQASSLSDILVQDVISNSALVGMVEAEPRYRAIAIGPGLGRGGEQAETILSLLKLGRPSVLDADALYAFYGARHSMVAAIKAETVITPHEGEFCGLFSDIDYKADRIGAAREAAKSLGAVVVLKGPDTIIASVDGRAAIASSAPHWLNVAGTGDILSGLILAGLTMGMPAFEAAARGGWLHGQAASYYSPGMIASDLLDAIPASLQNCFSSLMDS